MEVINISVRDKIAKTQGKPVYICGNSTYVVAFDFDDEWAGITVKTARFITGDTYRDEVFEGNQCPVPVFLDTRHIAVGVFAGNLKTTTPAYIPAKKSILCDEGLPEDPPSDVYAQILDLLNRGGVANGLPAGGKAGQVLTKKTDKDYDVEWADIQIPEQYGLVTYDNRKVITIT